VCFSPFDFAGSLLTTCKSCLCLVLWLIFILLVYLFWLFSCLNYQTQVFPKVSLFSGMGISTLACFHHLCSVKFTEITISLIIQMPLLILIFFFISWQQAKKFGSE
jgi:hypothetical protein